MKHISSHLVIVSIDELAFVIGSSWRRVESIVGISGVRVKHAHEHVLEMVH